MKTRTGNEVQIVRWKDWHRVVVTTDAGRYTVFQTKIQQEGKMFIALNYEFPTTQCVVGIFNEPYVGARTVQLSK